MSQLDLIAELRRGALVAPPELRERVRFIASQGPPTRRRITRRRTFAIAVPILAAAALATVVLSTRSTTTPSATMGPTLHGVEHSSAGSTGSAGGTTLGALPQQNTRHQIILQNNAKAAAAAPSTAAVITGSAPAPSQGRAQRYSASLALAVASADDVVSGSKRAVQIAQSEGGFLNGMNTNVAASKGYADLTLRVPRESVQETIARLSSLGTVTGENVTIQDLQGQLDSSARLLHRLRTQLAALEAQPQTSDVQTQITALEARISRLQRNHAATVREAKFATVFLELATKGQHAAVPAGHGPFHNIGTAFRAIGIGLVYGLAFGLPLLIVAGVIWLAYRGIHRRRENELLGTS